MSDSSDKKKGFAGFESLASDIKIEKPEATTADETVKPEEAESAPKASEPFFTPDLRGRAHKWMKGSGGYWVLGVFVLIAWGAVNDSAKHSSPNQGQYKITKIQPAPTPAPAPVPVHVNTLEDEAKLAATLDTLPIEQNYHPFIVPYTHSAIFTDFNDKIEQKKKLTLEDFERYQAASKAGDIDAMYVVAMMTKYGIATPKNENNADLLTFLAAQQGQPDAQRDTSFSLKAPVAKINYLMRAALQDDARAQASLGWDYFKGELVEQDYAKSFYWLKKAAEKYNAAAQLNIGIMYFSGDGTVKDTKKGLGWTLRAAENDNDNACAMLAAIYHDGEMVPKDNGKVYYWLTCADPKINSTININKVIKSELTEQDYITAADMGRMDAIVKIASDYFNGTNGLPKDSYKAEVYMQRHGFSENKNVNALKAKIAATLTKPQLDKAQDESITWLKAVVFDPVNAQSAIKKEAQKPAPQLPNFDESQPALGSFQTMTKAELRWCLYRHREADYINNQVPNDQTDTNEIAKQNVQYFTPQVQGQFDAFIADVNGRCPKNRQYLQADGNAVEAELRDPIYRNQADLAAQKLMHSWDSRFWFRE